MTDNLRKILSKITLSDPKDTTKSILSSYKKNSVCIVNFLYFANIILNKLDKKNDTSSKKESLSRALLSGDFLLPDGIALKILYKKFFGKNLPNLNGTDFLPYFLSNLPKEKKVEIIIYAGTDDVVYKSAAYITTTFGHKVIFAQNGFKEFDWNEVPEVKEEVIRIFLVWRGSPLQEMWTEKNKEKIVKMKCITFTVGGLLDFWSGTEKRAPFWMRKIKIEWLYRALSNPKKNLKKTLVSLQLLKYLI